MKRLLASGLLPQRAGQPVKALVHVSFAELCAMDTDSALQDMWIAEYRARWAARRAAASVDTGDGGAWLDGDNARAIIFDAMVIPVVTGDVDAGVVEDLIALCVRYHGFRTDAPVPAGLTGRTAQLAEQTAMVAEALAQLEHQILGKVLQVVSGPAEWPRSCAVTSWARTSTGRPSRWTWGRPTTSRCTCGAWSPCGTRPASTRAAAISPRPDARRTTLSTARRRAPA